MRRLHRAVIPQHCEFISCSLETSRPEVTTKFAKQFFANSSSAAAPQALPDDGLRLADFLPKGRLQHEEAQRPEPAGNPKVLIETYGCQQNLSDSEIVGSILASHGYRQARTEADADIVLLNTCSIREKAEAKILSRLGVLRRRERAGYAAATNPEPRRAPIIGVLGCMAERLKGKLLESERLADLVVGPDAYRDLPQLLTALQTGQARRQDAVSVQLSLEETYADIAPLRQDGAQSAFLSIMRGCNNMCTFCIVPFTRGRERSRPMTSIVEEVKMLADRGVREVTLLGQNVNSYADFTHESGWQPPSEAPFGPYATGFSSVYKPKRRGAVRFAELLDAVAGVEPEMRIWFTSPHPKEFSDEVLQVINERHNIGKMVHMPVQSGSTRVLEAMGRGYTRAAYDALVQHIRACIPGVALSTDIIAGFCGEMEEDHEQSMDLMRRTGYEQAFMFAYSRREGTRASRRLQDDVPSEVKKRRLNEIMTTFKTGLAESSAAECGRNHLMLIEGRSKDGQSLTGRSASMRRIRLPDEMVPSSLTDGSRGALVQLQPGDYVAVEVVGSVGGMLLAKGLARTELSGFVNMYGSVVPQCRGEQVQLIQAGRL